jgi:ABC-type branched-subunit amino acid transport system ATPase component
MNLRTLQDKLKKVEDELQSITYYPNFEYDGMPRGSGTSDFTAQKAIDIVTLQEIRDDLLREIQAEQKRLLELFKGDPNEEILILWHINGLTYSEIEELTGRDRKEIYRIIKNFSKTT